MQQGKTIAKGALHEIPGLTEAIGTAVAQTGVDLKNTIEIVFTDKNGVTRRAQADAAGNFRLDGIQGSVESLVNGGR
jgi:hypothetical protein